ncbi:MAG: hypothetical protein IAE94_02110 [Chthoniobacterales bacterium]|nr:hypothetical protein [Chthoniobacterales bacterium]
MRITPSSSLTAIILTVFSLSPFVQAQQSALNTEIQILKIDANFVESPRLNAAGYMKKSAGRPSPWLEVEVTFDRAVSAKEPKYAEELTVNYYVLLKNESVNEDKKPTLLTGSVVHVNVPQEKGLHSVMFVTPRALAKFFDGKVPSNAQQALTDVGVTISGKNGLLAIATFKGTVKGDKGWWDNSAAFTLASGALLNKSETPFAPLEWDFYETLKSKSGN